MVRRHSCHSVLSLPVEALKIERGYETPSTIAPRFHSATYYIGYIFPNAFLSITRAIQGHKFLIKKSSHKLEHLLTHYRMFGQNKATHRY
ncbi:MAG: hypothetical protein NVS4B9_29420 [Ktedonobacteraceae bacterium]